MHLFRTILLKRQEIANVGDCAVESKPFTLSVTMVSGYNYTGNTVDITPKFKVSQSYYQAIHFLGTYLNQSNH